MSDFLQHYQLHLQTSKSLNLSPQLELHYLYFCEFLLSLFPICWVWGNTLKEFANVRIYVNIASTWQFLAYIAILHFPPYLAFIEIDVEKLHLFISRRAVHLYLIKTSNWLAWLIASKVLLKHTFAAILIVPSKPETQTFFNPVN